MKTSQAGVDLIKKFEGFSAKAVRLQGEQYWTIGYGHYGPDVAPNRVITLAEGEALLKKDLVYFEGIVTSYCNMFARFIPNQNQFDALVSFCYNCGPGNLKTLVNGRTEGQVASHIMAYTNSGSEAYRQGLINRRTQEKKLFLTPVEDDDMTGEEIYNKLQEYLSSQEIPKWAREEFAEAVVLGITDGSNPMQLIPRYQAAIMAKRAKEK